MDTEKEIEHQWIYQPEVSLTIPQPVMGGVQFFQKQQPQFKYYVDGGFFQFPLSIKKMGFRVMTLEGGFRYSPDDQWYALAIGIGYRKIGFYTDVSAYTIDGAVIATNGIIHLSTLYLSPMFEAKVSLSKNASLVFGIGLQVPIVGSGYLELVNKNNGTDSGNSEILSVDSGHNIDRISTLILPRLTLVRLIWNI